MNNTDLVYVDGSGSPADSSALNAELVPPETIATAYNSAQAILDDWLGYAVEVGDQGLHNTVMTLAQHNFDLATAATTHHDALIALQAFSVQIVEQRNTALLELKDLDDGIKDIWMTEHPKLRPVYETIMDAHNSAFWESLPYDMAAVLGEGWSHMDADLLYTLITIEEEMVDEDGGEYGFTHAQLMAFRRKLLEMIKAL